MKKRRGRPFPALGMTTPPGMVTACAILLAALAGCGMDVPTDVIDPPDNGDVTDGNRDQSLSSPRGKTSGEPNDTFTQPVVAVFDDGGTARLQGTVSISGDLDIYHLGAVSVGDRVRIDAATTGSALDVSIAVFDDVQRLVYNNDDRGGPVDRFFDSYLQWVVRHGGDPYYMVVTHSAFASRHQITGSYSIDIHIDGGFAVPPPVGQVLMLDFDGGTVSSPTLGNVTIEPFDAGSIDSAYARRDYELKAEIRATVEQNFERFGVTVLTSDDPPPARDVEFSTVYFGGFDPMAFGLAEAVDLYNVDYCDDAIIYTESFTSSVFSRLPSLEGMGVAIGNVAAHEAGHLLGLNHVDDDLALMDDRSPADAFLQDQEFKQASLSSDIMPIGTQDAVLLLTETVGMR